MANLILTNDCNASCEFCFAAEHRSRSRRNGLRMMDGPEFSAYLEFICRTGIKELRLLGGEPTLHPQFSDFVGAGRDRGMSILVFTNGLMPDAALNTLADLAPDVCTVIVNMNAALTYGRQERLREVLQTLGKRAVPGITLTSPNFSLLPILSVIEQFGLERKIRVGLSHPVWRGNNISLHQKRYPAVGEALFEQSFLTGKYGIILEADCGFVRCMFGEYFNQLCANGFRYSSNCTPVVDLCSGGTILPCFALSGLMSLNRDDFPDTQAVYEAFSGRLRPWHTFGIYPECTCCPYFESSECCGGCIAARLKRINSFALPDRSGNDGAEVI